MKTILSLFTILSRLGKGRAVLLVFLMLINSFLEGVGLATLLPLLLLAAEGNIGENASPLAQTMADILHMLGLPLELVPLMLISATALILREVAGYAINIYAGFLITDLAADYRMRLMDAIVRARLPWYHAQQTGGMAVSLAQFPENATSALTTSVLALTLFLRSLIYVLLVIFISPLLAVGMLVLGALLYGPLLILIRLSHKYGGKLAGSAAGLSSSFTDIQSSIKTIKAMGLEDNIRPLLKRFIDRLRIMRRRTFMTSYGLSALQNISALLLVFSLLSVAVMWLKMPVVEVGMVAGLMLSIVKTFSRAQRTLQATAQHAPYLERIEKLIASAHAHRESFSGKAAPSLDKAIAFEGVDFSYTDKPVLSGASFVVPAGRVSVIIGPSGSGKTTIIDLVTGLYRPNAGRIVIDDTPLEDIDLARWRGMIGYVPQDLVLLSGSVRDNITLGAKADDDAIWRTLEMAGAKGFVEELPEGLDTDLGERGVRLSGGQRQRLSLARALVRQPRLLILDEVTSALDPDTEKRLVNQIGQLSGGQMTIIAITHNDAWLKVADKVLRLENGKVSEQEQTTQE